LGAPLIAALWFTFLVVSSASADSSYVVQRGDTLFRIALNHGLTTQELALANNIINPDIIYAGQVLNIPDGAVTDESDPVESQTSTTEAAESTYVVQLGDTLFRIASRFGLSTQVLAQVNGISNPSFIYAGQTLTIPGENSVAPIENSLPPVASHSYGERWIDVDLTAQRLTAYEENQPVYSTLISSGTWQYPTVMGLFQVYLRYESQTMNGYRLGYDYYLPNVPYVMYFYRDYAIHGTYWHNNFGTPMSHGCVNTPTPDAMWLYHWSGYGTPVYVHY
jgi:LysM repeat protein